MPSRVTDNELIRWVHRARHLSSMMALRASANTTDARLERQFCYEYEKLKDKGRLRRKPVRYAPASQREGAEAASLAISSRQDLYVSSPTPATTGGKRQASHSDAEHDVRNCQRRTGSLADKPPLILTSSTTLGTRATLPDTDFEPDDDASGEVSSHGSEDSRVHRATPAKAGVLAQVHENLGHEVNRFVETLDQTQSALEAVKKHLQVLEQQQPRMKGQVDLLVRMMQPAKQPNSWTQALSCPRGMDPDMV